MRYAVAFILFFAGIAACQLFWKEGWYVAGSTSAFFGGVFMSLWLGFTKHHGR